MKKLVTVLGIVCFWLVSWPILFLQGADGVTGAAPVTAGGVRAAMLPILRNNRSKLNDLGPEIL